MAKFSIMALVVALLIVCLPNAGVTDFDRYNCYRKCARQPVPLGLLGGEASSHYLTQGSYDTCMQECERQFWKDFDEKAKDDKEKEK
ncbi:MAG: hypothetical protein HY913_01730 [Desulfomonile tiedjei]|nr:hypothetical protein [Desulfomonile tiedjei]